MAENRITYDEPCPTCLDAGIKNMLFLDMDKIEIRCELDHVFTQLPSEKALQSAQGGTENSENIGVVTEPIRMAPKIEPVNTLEVEPDPEAGVERLAEIAQQLTPDAVNVPPEPKQKIDLSMYRDGVTVGRDGALNGVATVAENGAVVLPNGDLLLGVVIPETWRTAVEAEAQAQLKSPAAYFADWLTSDEVRAAIVDALGTYWTANYTQTV